MGWLKKKKNTNSKKREKNLHSFFKFSDNLQKKKTDAVLFKLLGSSHRFSYCTRWGAEKFSYAVRRTV